MLNVTQDQIRLIMVNGTSYLSLKITLAKLMKLKGKAKRAFCAIKEEIKNSDISVRIWLPSPNRRFSQPHLMTVKQFVTNWENIQLDRCIHNVIGVTQTVALVQ